MYGATKQLGQRQGIGIRRLLPLIVLLLLAPTRAEAQDGTFEVSVTPKTSQHYFFGEGFSDGFVVGGEQGEVLTLVRGETYTFQMQDVPSIHGFYMTTSREGLGAEPSSPPRRRST